MRVKSGNWDPCNTLIRIVSRRRSKKKKSPHTIAFVFLPFFLISCFNLNMHCWVFFSRSGSVLKFLNCQTDSVSNPPSACVHVLV